MAIAMRRHSPEDVATINRLVKRLDLANPQDREDAKEEAWVGWLTTGCNEDATWKYLVGWHERGERGWPLAEETDDEINEINETDMGPDFNLDDMPGGGSTPLAMLIEQESSDGLYAAISQLAEHLRETMRLRAQGYTGPEIASKLGVPEGTIWSRIHEGKAELKTLLMEAEG